MSVSAIARQSGLDRKTVRKYIHRGLEAPACGTRKPRQTILDPFTGYLRDRGAMILTSNRGFAKWGEVFGDPVVATALLDRRLHHAVVIQIEGSSYRLRQHAELMPEHVRSKALITPPNPAPVSRPPGRPPKNGPRPLGM